MNTQLTIRNIPEPVSLYLRKKAKLNNKSLNQVVIEELSKDVPNLNNPLSSSLAWFIGSSIDHQTVEALRVEDKRQKERFAKENAIS
jgi:plasmid stability protein